MPRIPALWVQFKVALVQVEFTFRGEQEPGGGVRRMNYEQSHGCP